MRRSDGILKLVTQIESEDIEFYKERIDWSQPVHCLSMGAGVQTATILFKSPERTATR